jgi:hypothetical protein
MSACSCIAARHLDRIDGEHRAHAPLCRTLREVARGAFDRPLGSVEANRQIVESRSHRHKIRGLALLARLTRETGTLRKARDDVGRLFVNGEQSDDDPAPRVSVGNLHE